MLRRKGKGLVVRIAGAATCNVKPHAVVFARYGQMPYVCAPLQGRCHRDWVACPRKYSSSPLQNVLVEAPKPGRQFPASGEVFKEQTRVGSHTVVFETGKLAKFAAGAAVVGIKETKVLTTVVADYTQKESSGFLPLQVEYREKQYAQGKIPNTFMRREGAPKERELLCARVIDRSIRPLFPKGFLFETQIIANVLCSDGDQDTDILSMNAASTALTISNIPWNGPIGAVRVGRVKGKFIVNPNMDEIAKSNLNMIYACTAERTVMIETQAGEITNEDYVVALQLAHAEAIKLIEPQLRLAAKVKYEKSSVELHTIEDTILAKVRELAKNPIQLVMGDPSYGKFERGKTLTKVQDDVEAIFKAQGHEDIVKVLPAAFDTIKKEVVRGNVLEAGVRVDGRALHEVRELYCEAGLYPSLHGSSVFSRGNTQVMCTVTMGSPEDAQRLDSIVGPESKRFMVHYSFPPFSVNEVGRLGGLNRREVGHGTLAEKALVSLLPPEEEFPYSIRVTSEVLASDGSSSMATVCGGSLALMDAGVPLREHVAGVSIGLVTKVDPSTGEIKEYRLLTDILGLEDHLGDMDFKIAGTRNGITAVQLDMKLPGIPLKVLCEALEQALAGRIYILNAMEKTVMKPREDLKENTPRRGQLTILRDTIGRLIGPQGANIRNIQRVTGAKLNVTDDGVLTIFAKDQASYDQTKEMVEACVGREVEVGGAYIATVVAIKDFGAFVELEGGHQGLVHISEIAHDKVVRIGDVLILGQQLKVVCIGRDVRGNLKLSRKAAIPLVVENISDSTPTAASSSHEEITGSFGVQGASLSLELLKAPAASSHKEITGSVGVQEDPSVSLELLKAPATSFHKDITDSIGVEGEPSLSRERLQAPPCEPSPACSSVDLAASSKSGVKKRRKKSKSNESEHHNLVEGAAYELTVKRVDLGGAIVETGDGVSGFLSFYQGQMDLLVGAKILATCVTSVAAGLPIFEVRA